MLKWETLRAEWPNASVSEFVDLGGIRWHVQRAGDSPGSVLFVHGSGASTHSWAGVLEALPGGVGWTAVDLPGHAFTRVTPGLRDLAGPVGIGERLADLVDHLEERPRLVVGHSAGAAIALETARRIGAPAVFALNPSFVDALGTRVERFAAELAGPFIRSDAVGLALATLARGTPVTDTLLDGTGSDAPEWSRRCYRRLFRDGDHVTAVMRLFSHWSVEETTRAIARYEGRLACTTGSGDRWVREADVRNALAAAGRTETVEAVPGGHLVHEETPGVVAARIERLLAITAR